MTALVVLLAVVVALLTVLVVGLLRSYGEVLRRLHEAGIAVDDADPAADRAAGPAAGRLPAGGAEEAADIARRLEGGVAPPRQGADEAFLPAVADLAGVTPGGDAVAVGLRGGDRITMVAFLSSGCGTCANFWAALRGGERLAVSGRDVRLVVVTGGPRNEQPSTVAALAGPDLTVVMSDDAWQHYAVPATPYFVLIDGQQGILGEGSAMGWAQLVGLLERAVADRGFDLQASAVTPASAVPMSAVPMSAAGGVPVAGAGPGAPGGARPPADLRLPGDGPHREARADAALLAAGIGPGHEQLYRSPLDDDAAADAEPEPGPGGAGTDPARPAPGARPGPGL